MKTPGFRGEQHKGDLVLRQKQPPRSSPRKLWHLGGTELHLRAKSKKTLTGVTGCPSCATRACCFPVWLRGWLFVCGWLFWVALWVAFWGGLKGHRWPRALKGHPFGCSVEICSNQNLCYMRMSLFEAPVFGLAVHW